MTLEGYLWIGGVTWLFSVAAILHFMRNAKLLGERLDMEADRANAAEAKAHQAQAAFEETDCRLRYVLEEHASALKTA